MDEARLDEHAPVSLRDLCRYFLKLGAFGFGGPIALAGYIQRDLTEARRWVTPDEFQDGLALAQTMPGPLVAQLAMWIGFIRYGVLGASLVGVLFVLPTFLLVVGVAALYVQFQGLAVLRALLYGIGPAAIALIALAAWKLAKATNRTDPRLWGIAALLLILTVVTRTELAWLFLVAGLLGILVYAPPEQRRWRSLRDKMHLPGLLVLPPLPLTIGAFPPLDGTTLVTLTLFFLQAAAFTFGSGLAIVPFLHQGVVVDHHWVSERQFLDAVAMGIITPGPVVIMASFVGYLVAGLAGATLAAVAMFAPVWVINVVVGRLFLRYRASWPVRGFVKGATAAAVGAIAGAAIVLGEGALVDAATAAIFVVALALLWSKRVPEPLIIGLAGGAGMLLIHG